MAKQLMARLRYATAAYAFLKKWSLIYAGEQRERERESELTKLEAIDCGKPLEEAAWDILCPFTD